MRLFCNFSGSDYNCSALFEGVHGSITAIQACFAAIIFLVSIPINLLLIVAMIRYYYRLDKAFLLSVSILVSNTLVSALLNGEVFLTASFRAWLFGYWGCHIFAILTTTGLFSRCITVALLSVDRFCRVFFPFSYSKLAGKIIGGIFISSWLFSFVGPLMLYFSKGTGFNLAQPGCSIALVFTEVNERDRATVIATLICVIFIAAILPCILYTAMYLKSRSLRRVHPVMEIPHHSNVMEVQQRSKKITVTFGLMVVNFFVFTVIMIFIFGIAHVLKRLNVSSANFIVFAFLISTLHRCYLIADLGIILTDREERKALRRLFYRIC